MSAGSAANNTGDKDTYDPVTGTQYTKPKPKFVPPSIAILKGLTEGVSKIAKKSNLKRRKKFLDKKGITLEGDMSDEYISSKKGLSELKAQGYTTASDVANIRPEDRDNNQTQPQDMQTGIFPGESDPNAPKIPLDPKTSKENKKEATKYDPRKTKKKGMTKNILTSKQGVTQTSADYTLGVKNLLGRVV